MELNKHLSLCFVLLVVLVSVPSFTEGWGPHHRKHATSHTNAGHHSDGSQKLLLPSDPPSTLEEKKPADDRNLNGSPAWPSLPEEGWPDLSGYITVNSTAEARMFYVFYEARHPKQKLEDTPIILWLQGGPGCSSMVGVFYEMGPIVITEEIPPKLVRNEGAWTDVFGMLFIDNPVGVGFSETKDINAVPNGELSVARDLHLALTTFFSNRAPAFFRHRPFFIAGESYAGKYVPSLGYYTLKWRDDLNPHTDLAGTKPSHARHPAFRLDGLLVGNGMTDPQEMLRYMGRLFYYYGFVDGQQQNQMEDWTGKIIDLIQQEEWILAARERRQLLEWTQNITGLTTLFNVRRSTEYHQTIGGADILAELLSRGDVQKRLGVKPPYREFETCNSDVSNKLAADLMKSVGWMVNDLLTSVPVMLFQGQLDLKEGPASTEDWIKKLDWSGKDAWVKSPREIWRVDGTLAGYVKSHANLTHVTVLSAGHMVLHDQTLRMRNLVEDWVDRQLKMRP